MFVFLPPTNAVALLRSRTQVWFLALLLCCGMWTSSNAQPGGGGGLLIRSLFDAEGQPLSPQNDQLHIRLFEIEDTSQLAVVYQELTDILGLGVAGRYHPHGRTDSMSLYLPADICANMMFYPRRDPCPYRYGTNQRLLLVHQQDSMVIDFWGVMSENGAGNTEFIDSLCFLPGYFRYRCLVDRWKMEGIHQMEYQQRSLFESGLTPHTLAQLAPLTVFEKYGPIDPSLLDENRLSGLFFLWRAARKNRAMDYEESLASIRQFHLKGLEGYEEEVLAVQSNVYWKLGQPDTALVLLSRLIDQYPDYAYHRRRIAINNELKDWQAVLQDYQFLIDHDKGNIRHLKQRALFYRDQLGEYANAIADLSRIIASDPKSRKYGIPMQSSYLGDYYLERARVYYLDGQMDAAVRDFRAALGVKYWYNGAAYPLRVLDTIVQRHPEEAKLYLCRGMARTQAAYAPSNFEMTSQQMYRLALEDLDEAKRRGVEDVMLGLFEAYCYMRLRQWEKARQLLEPMGEKWPSDPRVHYYLYETKAQLGLYQEPKDKTREWERYLACRKKWQFDY
ncbi:MAG: tetratricopeptide repeat protein [Bacteroidota bacterium]